MRQIRFRFPGKLRKSAVACRALLPADGRRVWSVLFCTMMLFVLQGQKSSAFEKRSHNRQDWILHHVDTFRTQLGIGEEVQVAVVPREHRLVSVQRLREGENTFLLTFDQAFLDALDDDELMGVIAHEIGHVWIFTHHPYLQTERLANDIAMKVVPRETLVRVYRKVSAYSDHAPDVTRVLSD